MTRNPICTGAGRARTNWRAFSGRKGHRPLTSPIQNRAGTDRGSVCWLGHTHRRTAPPNQLRKVDPRSGSRNAPTSPLAFFGAMPQDFTGWQGFEWNIWVAQRKGENTFCRRRCKPGPRPGHMVGSDRQVATGLRVCGQIAGGADKNAPWPQTTSVLIECIDSPRL